MIKKSRGRIRNWFYKHDIFLFDLDGTLYLGKRLLPGSVALVKRLRAMGRRVYFFTNNSSKSHRDYFKKLKKFGLAQSPDEVVLSTEVLIQYLVRKKWRRVFLLGTPAMKKMLREAKIDPSAKNPQAVVVGFDKSLTYKKLHQAALFLARGLPFVVTHPDYFCPTEEGPEPDCGSIALALAATTQREPTIVLGKPHPAMIEEVKRRSRLPRARYVLVGDRLQTDVAMARASKISSLMVLSGDSQKHEVSRARFKPHFVTSSVKDLL